MTDSPRTSRRDFFRTASAGALVSTLAPSILRSAAAEVSANDRIQIATIGLGMMGLNDTNTALKVPGVELVAPVAEIEPYKILAAGRLPAREGFGFAFRHLAPKDGVCVGVFPKDDPGQVGEDATLTRALS